MEVRLAGSAGASPPPKRSTCSRPACCTAAGTASAVSPTPSSSRA